ncbi:MAG: class I SAM-dependent methyltransferase [Chlamydiia bacterium]|nr:class I SAM-dependent methyltransferase [Chlamydiia bacterium]
MLAQDYWNRIGSTKKFEDPLHLDKLTPYLPKSGSILEYGCGYGRMLKMLLEKGHRQLIGFDFAKAMIERGKSENPELDLRLLERSGEIPCKSASQNAVIMSTVLCSMTDSEEKKRLMDEIYRVLAPGGIFYLTDFLLCNAPYYEEKYAQGLKDFGKWGMYTTSENLIVCHYTSQEILELLKPFDIKWFEQFSFKTMNQNPANTFHAIAQKIG